MMIAVHTLNLPKDTPSLAQMADLCDSWDHMLYLKPKNIVLARTPPRCHCKDCSLNINAATET